MPTIKGNKIYYTPDELGYKDRGKKKWTGLMLSDHTEALKKVMEETTNKHDMTVSKPEMSEKEISKILMVAYTNNRPVKIKSNNMNVNNELYPDVECMVKGYKNEHIYLQTINEETFKCTLDEIRRVEFMNTHEWYNKLPY